MVLGIAMPPDAASRWHTTLTTHDFDGRQLNQAHWTVPKRVEPHDLGHWLKSCFESWLYGDEWAVVSAADRCLLDLAR